MAWQPIGTAPRDGSIVLLLIDGDCPVTAYHGATEFEEWSWISPLDPDVLYNEATHWAPIPDWPLAIK